MIVIILSLLDIIAGLWYFLGISYFLMTMGFLILVKGIVSFIPAVMSKYYFDWMGMVDILAGITIIFHSYFFHIPFFRFFVGLLIFKGIYSLVRHIIQI